MHLQKSLLLIKLNTINRKHGYRQHVRIRLEKHRRGKDSALVHHNYETRPSVLTGHVGLNNICCFL